MPPKAQQRAITRSRVMRDRHVKSITETYSNAFQVELGAVSESELEVRIDSFEEIESKFRREQEAVIDALIMVGTIGEFDRVDKPVSKLVDEMYFKVRHIISQLLKRKPSILFISCTNSKRVTES